MPKPTDPVTFCSFTSLFSKVIAVTCFNFMVMTGEVQLRTDYLSREYEDLEPTEEDAFQTSFIKFYSSMIETPFLGDRYNYILPGSMLVLSFLFLLLSYLRYESKVVALIRRFNNNVDQIES